MARKVLLTTGVEAFGHLTRHVASHKNWGEEAYPYPQPCVYLQTHYVEMHTTGWESVDFDTLAAVSGASALFGYKPGEFMPKYANLYIGMDQRIADATGFGYEWLKFEGIEQAWDIIRASVDSGRPVKGWHFENCAFLGYQDARRTRDRKVYAVGDGPGEFSTWWSWGEFVEWAEMVGKWGQWRLGRHTRRVRKRGAKPTALRVMKDLVDWSVRPPKVCRDRFPEATFGLSGIEAYATDCANVRKYPGWAMCHDINALWTVRNSTAVYLRRTAAAKSLPKSSADWLMIAAAQYKAAFASWHQTYGLLGHGATREQRRDPARRKAGAALIRDALEHEREGIRSLRKALVAMENSRNQGQPLSPVPPGDDDEGADRAGS